MTTAPGPHTVGEILAAGLRWLESRGVDAPRRSMELLLGHVLDLGRLQLYMQHDRPLEAGERAALRALVKRRGAGEPVAHLLGSWEFHGLELEVGPDVLVPRPETEELVERALRALPEDRPLRVVDLGTGSGAIAVAVAVARPAVRLVATDASAAALAVAQRNAERHGVAGRIRFAAGDWWQAAGPDAVFDVVLANPPYVDPARPELVEDAVARFEPEAALWTPAGDPGACYRAIAAGLGTHLVPGGWVLLETGVGAAEAARAALGACPALAGAEVELFADLAGQPRMLTARRPGTPDGAGGASRPPRPAAPVN